MGAVDVAAVGAGRILGVPAAAAFVGEIAGEQIGHHFGARDPVSNGACGLVGSVAAGAAAGAPFAGIGAPIGAAVGAAAWGAGKVIKGVAHLVSPSAASSSSNSEEERLYR